MAVNYPTKFSRIMDGLNPLDTSKQYKSKSYQTPQYSPMIGFTILNYTILALLIAIPAVIIITLSK